MDARADRVANGMTAHFGDRAKTFVVDPGAKDARFSWTCTEANLRHDAVSDPTQWGGTRLIRHPKRFGINLRNKLISKRSQH